MRVILDKGVSAKEDKTVQHGIEKKTELAKKAGSDGIVNSAKRVIKTAEDVQQVKRDARQIHDIAKQNHKKREITSGAAPKADKPNTAKPQYKQAAARSKKRVIYPQQEQKSGGAKHYKVLKNGTTSKDKLMKIKPKTLQNAVKIDTSRLHFKKISADRLKKLKLAKRKKYDTLMSDRWYNKSINLHLGGFKDISAGIRTTGVIFRPVTKRLNRITDKVVSSIDNDSVQFAKKSVDISKTAVETSGRTLKTSAKIVGKSARGLSKVIDPRERRRLKKSVRRQIKQLKREAKAVGKAAQKTAKAAAKAAKKTAELAAKAGKAVVQAVTRIIGFIVQTMPWSLIIIGILALVLIIVFAFMGMFGSAGGSVTGAGGWAIDDSNSMDEKAIYENFEKFRTQSKEVCDSNVKNNLHSEVDSFCVTSTPERIISYYDSSVSVTYYPATSGKSPVKTNVTNYLNSTMTPEKYSEFLAALFVLETREKQQAEGVNDATIYDFDFTKADFEEFIGSVDSNSCRYGSTFIIKTTTETTGEKCPGENCKTKTIPGCKCCSSTDPDTGRVTEYCGGHPYCPSDHTKLTVCLKTVEDYYNKPISEIYGFTENEKARYEATSAFIAALLKDKEEGII